MIEIRIAINILVMNCGLSSIIIDIKTEDKQRIAIDNPHTIEAGLEDVVSWYFVFGVNV